MRKRPPSEPTPCQCGCGANVSARDKPRIVLMRPTPGPHCTECTDGSEWRKRRDGKTDQRYRHPIGPCPACGGERPAPVSEEPEGDWECETCEGTGDRFGRSEFGPKYGDKIPCRDCRGSGRASEPKTEEDKR